MEATGRLVGAGGALVERAAGEGVGVAGDGEALGSGDGVEVGDVRAGSGFGLCVAAGATAPGYNPAAPSDEAPLPAANDAATKPMTTAPTSVAHRAARHVFTLSRRVFTVPQQM